MFIRSLVRASAQWMYRLLPSREDWLVFAPDLSSMEEEDEQGLAEKVCHGLIGPRQEVFWTVWATALSMA